MGRRIALALALAGFMLTADHVMAAGGGNRGMSPVGVWTIEYIDDLDPEDNNTIYQQYNHSGTLVGGAWTDSKTNTVGNWRKVGSHRYISTIWSMIPEADGYLKIIDEFWMIDKDTMEGRQEGWWIVGRDPLDPPVPPVGPLWTGSQQYRRLKAEPKQVP